MTASTAKDLELRRRAEAVIPGGMYGHQSVAALPDDYPQFFARGAGAYLWDVDGSRYLDLMCAYGRHHHGLGHGTRPYRPQDRGARQGRLSRRGALVHAARRGHDAGGSRQSAVLSL